MPLGWRSITFSKEIEVDKLLELLMSNGTPCLCYADDIIIIAKANLRAGSVRGLTLAKKWCQSRA